MEKREKHRAGGGERCPAIGDKDLAQLRQFGYVSLASCGEIAHQDDGNDDLVRREAENKRDEDDAV